MELWPTTSLEGKPELAREANDAWLARFGPQRELGATGDERELAGSEPSELGLGVELADG